MCCIPNERILSLFFFFLYVFVCFVFFQAEDGIRDLVRSRGLGDVYKRQVCVCVCVCLFYLNDLLLYVHACLLFLYMREIIIWF